jgi:hypothetical protein
MPATPELDEADRAVIVALLKQTIFNDPFPLSPRVQRLRGTLAKLAPPPLRPQPYPAPKPAGEPSIVLAKKKRRR